MNTRSLSRVMARNIFSADAARVSVPHKPTPGRYEARVGDKGWVVWDSEAGGAVETFFGRFNEAEALGAADRYNRLYARAVG